MAYTTINKSTEHFNTKLYTGTGSTQALTGVGFQPDWTWFKSRSGNNSHLLFDVVRGVTKGIYSNLSNAEDNLADSLSSFDSDGFTLGADTGSGGGVNGNTNSMASWNWKANGAGSANTDGDIASTVSVNTTSGFSIVKYTGNATDNASVGHGLGTAPKMLIIKEITSTSNWGVWHQDLTDGGYRLSLQETTAQVSDTAFMGGGNRAIPTNSVFYLGSGGGGNSSSDNYIAYAFSEIKGFSKMGSYTGNGSTDGPFVYTGFKPAFVITKRIDSTGGGWGINDNKRPNYNPENLYLVANTNSVEASDGSWTMDLLSNGWKARYNNGHFNASGGSYIYMAFAEAPLVGTNGVTAKAR